MEPSVVEQILDELLPSFEALETQSGAILQFLKDKGIATDEGLAPYLEQARSASAVRWRAARLRMNRVLAPAFQMTEKSAEEKRSESATKDAEKRSGATKEQSSGKAYNKQEDSQAPKDNQPPKKEAAPAKKDAASSVEKDQRTNTAAERSNKDAA